MAYSQVPTRSTTDANSASDINQLQDNIDVILGTEAASPTHDFDDFILKDGTRALTAAWDAGSFEIRAETFESDVATGTAPLTIASTTLVSNLNVDSVDGIHADFVSGDDGQIVRYEHTGTKIESSGTAISDLLAIADIDDTPADDANTCVSSQYIYQIVSSRVSVYLSADQSINDTTETKIQFNTEAIDILGEFDNATNYTFTPTNSGTYWYSFSVRMEGVADGKMVEGTVYKGGSTLINRKNISTGVASSANTVVCTGMVALTDSDTLDCRVWHNHGSAINAGGGLFDTMFHVHRIA